MSMRTCTSSQAYDEQPFALALTLEQHITIIMSRSIVVEWNIKLEDIYGPTFKGRTFPKAVKHVGWVPFIHMTSYALKNIVWESYCAILWARNLEEPSMEATTSFLAYHAPDLMLRHRPKKHTIELSYRGAEFIYLVVVQGLPVDMASYIYQFVRAMALKTDAQISLPHGILLTQFHHALLLTQRMQLIMLPTHEMVTSFNGRSITLERKVTHMDSGLKKEVATVQKVIKGVATGAELICPDSVGCADKGAPSKSS
ncbi:hypothetical protein CJ030_MR5G019087 [Morella rubra]|uniref:Uncharacterized protein n=1 Tax=Morella rubra TaxID=262757 RepID=A0A6A1VIB2_9ROSI|nr:hypothetical protein CJ030_MR5G019087 [Morella rubra]